MDKLKHMKTFMVAVEEGSIAQSANKLGISKAAASKQLIELEKNLNTQLLHRTTRKLKMTDTGQLFYEALKNVFSAVAEAESVIDQIHEQPAGTLRIASHRHFGERYIISNIKEFLSLYPDLKLDIHLADRFPDMEKEGIDVLCGVSHEGPDHLVRKKIATIRHVLCASPDYIAQYGKPKTPEDLHQHRYITHSFRNPDNILSFKNNKEVILDFEIRLNDAMSMLNCALSGLGIITIFNYFVDEHIKSGRLIEILREYSEPPVALYIFYQQHKYLPNKIRLFIDFICSKVNADICINPQS